MTPAAPLFQEASPDPDRELAHGAIASQIDALAIRFDARFMIVVQISDPTLRRAALRAPRPDEDAFWGPLGREALEFGFPRLLLREDSGRGGDDHGVPTVEIDAAQLGRWDRERRSEELPATRLDFLTQRIRELTDVAGAERSWVDRTLAELGRASGGRLPLPFLGFGRRVMEFPAHYRYLDPVADACGTTGGALKARFRRRGLASPSVYIRWFRILAVANVLADRSITVAVAARRLGYTSDGNLCRTLANVTRGTPTEMRTSAGWRRVLLDFTWNHLDPEALEAWATLDDLFAGTRAA